jgi:hypothetical protein
MRKKILVGILIMVILTSCGPEQELANRVHGTLSAMPTPAGRLTYTDYPTYTKNPTYTIEKSATLTPTASKTPDYTASAMPTSTERPTQPPDGTEAITATWINNHIPGQLFVDTNCGLSFEYPLEWMIEYANSRYPEKYLCFYGLRPNNYSQIVSKVDYCMGDYAVYIGVMNKNFADAAKETGFFYENGFWYSHAGIPSHAGAQIITTRGLTILRARVDRELWDKQCLGRWGILDYEIALITGRAEKSIIMWNEVNWEFSLHFEYILQTIKVL